MPTAKDSQLHEDQIVGVPTAENKRRQKAGLKIERYFTTSGVHPFEEIEWEHRDSAIYDEKGEVIFQQTAVEVPTSWSQLATDIAASKYFRKAGVPGTEQESSARQLIRRVAHTIRQSGVQMGGYFASPEDAETFEAETHPSAHYPARRLQLTGVVQLRSLARIRNQRRRRQLLLGFRNRKCPDDKKRL